MSTDAGLALLRLQLFTAAQRLQGDQLDELRALVRDVARLLEVDTAAAQALTDAARRWATHEAELAVARQRADLARTRRDDECSAATAAAFRRGDIAAPNWALRDAEFVEANKRYNMVQEAAQHAEAAETAARDELLVAARRLARTP